MDAQPEQHANETAESIQSTKLEIKNYPLARKRRVAKAILQQTNTETQTTNTQTIDIPDGIILGYD